MMVGMEKLTSYLEANGISQSEFAARIGVTPSVVSRYCSKGVTPDLQRAIVIERVTSGAVPVAAWVKE